MGRGDLLKTVSTQQTRGSALASAGPTCNRTPPNCARCRNHENIVQLRGHKRYCEYAECRCDKCRLTAERQKVMAKQTAIRRAEEQDRIRSQKGLPVPVPNLQKLLPQSKLLSPADRSSESPRDVIEDLSRSSSPDEPVPVEPQRVNPPSSQGSGEVWGSILLLINKYGLPINTSPLLHIILKRVTNDPETVYKFYIEGMQLKKSLHFSYLRMI